MTPKDIKEEVEESWEIAKILFPYTTMKAPQRKIIQSILSSSQPLFYHKPFFAILFDSNAREFLKF